jgi:hypothetical protein
MVVEIGALITFSCLYVRLFSFVAKTCVPSPDLGSIFFDAAIPADDLLFGHRGNNYCHINLSVLNYRVPRFHGYGLTWAKRTPEI